MPLWGINFVELQKPLLTKILKWAGVEQKLIEIEEGTTMSCWAPIKSSTKPPLVLVHGFAAEGGVTWQFQVGKLSKEYSVYIPDLLFFGKSVTVSRQRSETFQAECLMKLLKKLKVEKCAMVGFSYGGMVAFKMAEMYPEAVNCLVVSGSVIAMTDTISQTSLNRLGFSSSAELLLPTTVKGLKALFSVACYKKIWLPEFLFRDFLEVMFNNREERGELLAALVESNKVAQVPSLKQKILLLWGNKDEVFNLEVANRMRDQLGENTEFVGIENAGHLVHLERPCIYTTRLLEFLQKNYSNEMKYD
ncbi:hypothetical protein SUGI_0370310 [Cryptomeria japonica]|uniref:uncharacterized protein LOC131076292 n=1 Tax=Cryptomeria japonica TaxID=3369 RepID=UPI002408B298|nr:uncharacterized protein LOC131076292 [Cryptomeria japonica]GLJ20383.1 hypothetical protein SUGI_0370310 [Cryptomeria japonica]